MGVWTGKCDACDGTGNCQVCEGIGTNGNSFPKIVSDVTATENAAFAMDRVNIKMTRAPYSCLKSLGLSRTH